MGVGQVSRAVQRGPLRTQRRLPAVSAEHHHRRFTANRCGDDGGIASGPVHQFLRAETGFSRAEGSAQARISGDRFPRLARRPLAPGESVQSLLSSGEERRGTGLSPLSGQSPLR